MTLSNAFELPEDSINASNYDAAFNHLNSSNYDVILGLDIHTCDMQTLLSEVTILMKICEIPHAVMVFYSVCVVFVCSGSGGNRSGLYRLH